VRYLDSHTVKNARKLIQRYKKRKNISSREYFFIYVTMSSLNIDREDLNKDADEVGKLIRRIYEVAERFSIPDDKLESMRKFL
jgi:hypothetical protein